MKQSAEYYLPLVKSCEKIPPHEFTRLIQNTDRISESSHLFLSVLSMKCIANLFEIIPRRTLAKKTAYNAYKLWLNYYYLQQNNLPSYKGYKKLEPLNSSNFGKLIRIMFNEAAVSKRIGSRASSRYCYLSLSIKPSVLPWLDVISNKVKRYSFITRDNRYSPLKLNVKSSILDSKFKFFLKNDLKDFDYQTHDQKTNINSKDFQSENFLKLKSSLNDNDLELKIKKLLNLLNRSDLLLNNFILSTSNDKHEIFQQMIDDWNGINAMNIIKECFNKELDEKTIKIINYFPNILQEYQSSMENNIDQFNFLFSPLSNPIEETSPSSLLYDGLQKPLLNKTFKMELIDSISKIDGDNVELTYLPESPVLQLKIYLTELFIQLLSSFPRIDMYKILLNFKYISTALLRNLTINNKKSFGYYWILSSFMEEYFTFLIEYYSHKKSLLGIFT